MLEVEIFCFEFYNNSVIIAIGFHAYHCFCGSSVLFDIVREEL